MLQRLDIEPFVAAVIALLGVAVGLAISRFVLPGTRKIKRLESEIEQLRRAHADYRSRVSSHFHKTSELVGQMTASYKAVYDHLSDGAQSLCAGDALPAPAFSAPRLILADEVEVTSGGVASAGAAPGSSAASPRSDAIEGSAGTPVKESAVAATSAGGASEGVAQSEPAESAAAEADSRPGTSA